MQVEQLRLQEEKRLVAEINKLKRSKRNLRYNAVGIQTALFFISVNTCVKAMPFWSDFGPGMWLFYIKPSLLGVNEFLVWIISLTLC